MNYILEKTVNTLEIQRSEFITVLCPINTQDEAKNILDELRKSYPKATHYCYAYILESYMKFSDDGEPSGTAGKPMLGVLQSKNISNVLAVVIRYFGGIKLGAGGLLRAYVNSVSSALDRAILYEKKLLDVAVLEVPYKYNDSLFYYLNKNNYVIKKKEFLDAIYVEVSKELINEKELLELFSGNIKIDYKQKEEVFVKIK